MDLSLFINIRKFPSVKIDLKYASTDNFMSENVYRNFTEAYLHPEAAEKFRKAISILAEEKPRWSFIIFDALRPRSAQRELWKHVVGTPQQGYVANPDKGSIHNYGCAIDLGLVDENENLVDMGTGFDSFVPLSQPKLEEEFLAQGKLTQLHIDNRKVLRRAMVGGGFIQLPHEWWHYDAFPGDEVRARFRIVE